jgi:hypothetical protein
MENPLAGLRVELSEEERARDAERLRRLFSVAQGIHPDTGKRLHRADLADLLGASERFQAQQWLATNPAPGRILEHRLIKSAERLFFKVAQAQDVVDRARKYVEGLLAELSLAFQHDRNPMHAWEAYQIARVNEHDIPEWILQYLDRAAASLVLLRDDAADGNPPEREAHAVGKAIGFGKRRGETGYLKAHAMFCRDLEIYFDLKDQIDQKSSRYKTTNVKMIAVEEIAKKHGIDAATVRRADDRTRALFKDDDRDFA